MKNYFKPITKYKLIHTTCPNRLAEQVNIAIANGWSTVGGVTFNSFTKHTGGTSPEVRTEVLQAMSKIEYPEFTFPPINLWSYPKQERDYK